MEVLHRQLGRYAVFEVESEAEALEHLGASTARMYESAPRLIRFNEEGALVTEQASDADEGSPRDRGDWEEYEDGTITLARFGGGTQLLTLELFNDFEDPNDPLYADNIVLARHLEMRCRGKT